MGNLYQVLRKKMEGTNQEGQSSQPRRGLSGNSNGGKQGMADTIAEMTKKYCQVSTTTIRFNHVPTVLLNFKPLKVICFGKENEHFSVVSVYPGRPTFNKLKKTLRNMQNQSWR